MSLELILTLPQLAKLKDPGLRFSRPRLPALRSCRPTRPMLPFKIELPLRRIFYAQPLATAITVLLPCPSHEPLHLLSRITPQSYATITQSFELCRMLFDFNEGLLADVTLHSLCTPKRTRMLPSVRRHTKWAWVRGNIAARPPPLHSSLPGSSAPTDDHRSILFLRLPIVVAPALFHSLSMHLPTRLLKFSFNLSILLSYKLVATYHIQRHTDHD